MSVATFQQGVSGYTGGKAATIASFSTNEHITELMYANRGLEYLCVLYFDISSIPSGATIQSAILTITVYETNFADDIICGRILDPDASGAFDEAGSSTDTFNDYATWNNKDHGVPTPWDSGGTNILDVLNTAEDTISQTLFYTGALDFDVTTMVSGWVAGTFPNAGMYIRGVGTTATRFRGNYYATTTDRPLLTVTYTDKTYTKTFRFNLPSNDADLDSLFTTQEYTDVATNDAVRVTQTGQDAYVMFLFKDSNPSPSNNRLSVSWDGQSDIAPSSQSVIMEVYNRNSTTWETIASNNSAAANTDFTLNGTVYPLTNYKDGSGIVACRVRQNVTISSSSCSSSSRSSSSRSSSSSSSSCRSSSSSCSSSSCRSSSSSSCRSSSSSSSCRSSSSSSCRSSSSSSSCRSSSSSSCRSSSSSSRNACWVAAELFGGWYEPKTVAARAYVLNIAPDWFRNAYIKHGREVARFIKNNAWAKAIIKPLFESFARTGKEWMKRNGNVN